MSAITFTAQGGINYKNLDREIETKAFKKGGKGISHPRINYKNLDHEIETYQVHQYQVHHYTGINYKNLDYEIETLPCNLLHPPCTLD